MNKKILVVDDETDVQLIVKTTLQHDGYSVITASNGPDGLAAAREEKPDLIVLDVMMPGMDGFEVLNQLKADDETCDIPVLMLTGVSEKSRIRQALETGIQYYLVKPFDVSDLLTKVKQALSADDLSL